MGTTMNKNKIIFKLPRCYQQNMLEKKNSSCKGLEWRHVSLWRANEGNVYSAHSFIDASLPWALHVPWRQCALMALEAREPSNCELQQSLCQWKQWITGAPTWDAVATPYMCHRCVMWYGCLPWWGSMFRKCVKSCRRHPAIPQVTHAHEYILKSFCCR